MEENSDRYGKRDAYNSREALRENYESFEDIEKRVNLTPAEEQAILAGELVTRRNIIDLEGLNKLEAETLKTRPRGGVPPKRLAAYGHYNIACAIDFGSYRDLQRHRNGVAPLPLLEARFGMFKWYTDELADLLGTDYTELESATSALYAQIEDLPNQGIKTDRLLTQYLLPMGTTAICTVSYSVPQMIYVGELRSGKTVHPSLRPIAQGFLRILEKDLPGIALHGDMDADSWSEKRGTQTITEKKAS
jgi:hypothetical protein